MLLVFDADGIAIIAAFMGSLLRAIKGEVRLWVNGEEASGGKDCKPASGFLCPESKGSSLEFRGLRIREFP